MRRYFALALLMALLSLTTFFAASSAFLQRSTDSVSGDYESEHLPGAISLPSSKLLSAEDAAEIDRLIHQLSSSSFAERETAMRRLKTIGDPAVGAIRAAAGKGAYLELRLRAELLLTEILTKDLPQRFGESIANVEKILPDGWSIMRTVSGSTPPDWWTKDRKAGFLVEARNGKEILQIWFLPLDWIGIRKTPNRACHAGYWEGILAGDKYKTITFATDTSWELQKRVEHLGGYTLGTPSLVNGGFDRALRIFAGKLERADRIAWSLVRKHCRTSEQVREAIASLQVLGVPARTLFLHVAGKARGENRSRYTSILGQLGGAEAISLLCDIATDLQVSAYERNYAILALERHQDSRIGPTLHTALMQLPDGEGLQSVVKGLTHRRYKPAEADLLALFKHQPKNSYARGALADALATFRCKEAVPELSRLRRELSKEPKRHQVMLASLDLALLRLTGDWGEAGEGARLFIVPPEQPRLGEKIQLTVHLENTGSEPIAIDPLPREMGLHVDGKAVFKQTIFFVTGMVILIHPGEVWTFACDLTPYIKTAGRHQAQYVGHGAHSNVAVFTVRAAKP